MPTNNVYTFRDSEWKKILSSAGGRTGIYSKKHTGKHLKYYTAGTDSGMSHNNCLFPYLAFQCVLLIMNAR